MSTPPRIEDGTRRLPPWLAGALLRRGDLAPRFVYWRQQLARQSRGWRRRLRRQLALGVTGAALLLAVAGAGAQIDPAAADATITVVNGQVNVAANGQCSLMEAIQNANNKTNGRPYTDCAAGNPNGADTINLPANGLFTLNTPFVPDAAVGPIGLPWISSTITLNGNGSTIQRGANAPNFRVMAVGNQGNLTLNNTTVRNGYLYMEDTNEFANGGAGILNQGQLSLSGSIVSSNETSGGDYVTTIGGGIDNRGTLNISGSSIVDNVANGGIGGGVGGGIDNSGQLVITNSLISSNEASGYFGSGSGGGINNNGNLTISGSTVSNNSAGGLITSTGGGIDNNGNVTILSSTISGNLVGGRNAYGGGIFSHGGSTTIGHSTIEYNEIYGRYDMGGGAIGAWGVTVIYGSTINGNKAGSGPIEGYGYIYEGAIVNSGDMTISNSTITNNDNYDNGSAIGNLGNLTIVNSTISGNNGGVVTACYSENNTTWVMQPTFCKSA
jgi:hypothetical protein